MKTTFLISAFSISFLVALAAILDALISKNAVLNTSTNSAYFMAHGGCFLWDKIVFNKFLYGNLMTWFSYMVIPVFLGIYLANKKVDIDYIDIIFLLLFLLFIASCGIGHVINAYNLTHHDYNFEANWTIVTGIISNLCFVWVAINFKHLCRDRKVEIAEKIVKEIFKNEDNHV